VKARTKSGVKQFALLPVSLLWHVSVATLDHAEFRALVLLAAQYRGTNNGAVGITAKQVSEAGIGSKHTFYRALRELQSRGLIEQTYPASRVPPRPAMYALSWWPVNDTDYSTATRVASHGYRKWNPDRKFSRGTECTQGGAVSAPMELDTGATGAVSAPMEAKTADPWVHSQSPFKNMPYGRRES
jgi:hypothetical protein